MSSSLKKSEAAIVGLNAPFADHLLERKSLRRAARDDIDRELTLTDRLPGIARGLRRIDLPVQRDQPSTIGADKKHLYFATVARLPIACFVCDLPVRL